MTANANPPQRWIQSCEEYAPRVFQLPLIDRVPWIARHACGQRVLHLGCIGRPEAPDHLHRALHAFAAKLIGLDCDLQRRQLLPPDDERHRIEQLDVSRQLDLLRFLDGQLFDLIVAGELLEHLANPGALLSLLALRAAGANLIVTVPNALRRQNAIDAAAGIERVHAHHVCWYSPATITRLLEVTGWNLVKLYGCRDGTAESYGKGNVAAPRLAALART